MWQDSVVMSEFLQPQMWMETSKSEAILLIRLNAFSLISFGKARPCEFFMPMASVVPSE